MRNILSILLVFLAVIFLFGSTGRAETVHIIAEDAWFPYSGETSNGTVEGIAVDIVRETFQAEGIDVQFDIMNYDRCLLAVKDGYGIGCFNCARTEETEEVYLWHDEPLFMNSTSYYARADYPGRIDSIQDVMGKTVGLTQGYQYGDALDLNDHIEKEYSKTDEIILKKLLAGRVDLIVLWEKVAEYLIGKFNARDKVKRVGDLQTLGLYVVFSKKHPDGQKYRDIFSDGFRTIKENGTYQRIFDEWDAKLRQADPALSQN